MVEDGEGSCWYMYRCVLYNFAMIVHDREYSKLFVMIGWEIDSSAFGRRLERRSPRSKFELFSTSRTPVSPPNMSCRIGSQPPPLALLLRPDFRPPPPLALTVAPSSASQSHPSLPIKLPDQPTHDLLLPLPPHRPPKQPIRHAYNPTRLIPAAALFGVLNRVREYAPFLVELENEQSVEFLFGVAHAEPFGDFVNGFVVAVVQGPSILAVGRGLEFPTCFPAHDEALVEDAFCGR